MSGTVYTKSSGKDKASKKRNLDTIEQAKKAMQKLGFHNLKIVLLAIYLVDDKKWAKAWESHTVQMGPKAKFSDVPCVINMKKSGRGQSNVQFRGKSDNKFVSHCQQNDSSS